MKKIILTALAVLMMFVLVGCSGVLHDFVDPPAPPGNWYYVDVPTDTKNIIINFDSTDTNIDADGNGIVQSADIEVDVSEGSVYYTFYADVKEKAAGQYVKATENLPESKAGRVWVFAEKADIRVYYWGGSEDASWPGVGLTKEGETVVPDEVYNLTLVVDGFNSGDKVLVNGSVFGWNGWPFVSWLGWDDNGNQDVEKAEQDAKAWIDENAETQVVTADDAGIITVKVTLETLVRKQTLKFVKTTIDANGVYTNGDDTGDIPLELPEKGGAYFIRYTFAKGKTTPAEVK